MKIPETKVRLVFGGDKQSLIFRWVEHFDERVEVAVIVSKAGSVLPEPFVPYDVNHLF
jgi:hypothetical protein